jgi:hypothetical protein
VEVADVRQGFQQRRDAAQRVLLAVVGGHVVLPAFKCT